MAHWREMQRQQRPASFFTPNIQPAADEMDEHNTIRRRA
jgi:hypothetical protein